MNITEATVFSLPHPKLLSCTEMQAAPASSPARKPWSVSMEMRWNSWPCKSFTSMFTCGFVDMLWTSREVMNHHTSYQTLSWDPSSQTCTCRYPYIYIYLLYLFMHQTDPFQSEQQWTPAHRESSQPSSLATPRLVHITETRSSWYLLL